MQNLRKKRDPTPFLLRNATNLDNECWLKNTKTVTSSDKLAAFKKHTKSELRTSLSHKQLTQIHMKKRQKLTSKLFLINQRYFTVPQ